MIGFGFGGPEKFGPMNSDGDKIVHENNPHPPPPHPSGPAAAALPDDAPSEADHHHGGGSGRRRIHSCVEEERAIFWSFRQGVYFAYKWRSVLSFIGIQNFDQ